MKIDLIDATFIIPIRIESEDRLRNVITSVAFLLNNFNTNIIIKGVDKTSVFKERALPQLESFFEDVKVKHVFEESDEPLFHRQKVLNEMIMEADTEIVVNYDCDVILPLESYVTAYMGIKEKIYDVVYPYGNGMYQRQVNAEDKIVSAFLDSNDYSALDAVSNEHTSDFGWAQFFRRSVYIDGGMENENFRAYAPEDKERYYRFTTLGYKVGRINSVVYHLEHARGENSWFSNPHMDSNLNEWEMISRMDKKQLMDYYSKQKYLEKYARI